MPVEKENAEANNRPMKITRRRLLGTAARLAALAAASSILPPNLRRALAQEPPGRNSLRDIKHVVLLMQENRSFDHYFGTLAGVRGFDDANAMTLSHGKSVFYQPDRKIPTDICCRSIWTRMRPAPKKSRPPIIHGDASTLRGTVAKWTIGCRRTETLSQPRRRM